MVLADELKNLIEGEVENSEEVLKKYSRDASLFEVMPEVVVFPKNARDIEKLVQFVNNNKHKYPNLSLTARSGGTDMTGGPLNDSIILDLTRYFNRIKKVTEEYIITEPGVFYRDFEKETLKKGAILPSFPASREICTIGGMVANNSGGERTLKYGKTSDFIIELKAVFADGKEHKITPLTKEMLLNRIETGGFEGGIYKQLFPLLRDNATIISEAKPDVSKNSAGYNLWDMWDGRTFNLPKLIVGSQGTLCIITEVTLRLVKTKPYSGMVIAFLDNLDSLGHIINRSLEFKPLTLESFDDKTLKLALKFFPSFLKLMGSKNILSLAWKFLPEFWLVLRSGGFPKLILLAEFESEKESEIKMKTTELKKALSAFHVKTRIAKGEKGITKYHLMRRESFNLLRNRIKDKQTAPFIDDLCVRSEHLPRFLPELYEILNRYDLLYTIAGHLGNGNLHIIPLMTLSNEKERNKIKPLMDEVYGLIFKYRGSITAEHNDGLIRTPYLEKMYGKKAYDIFRKVKNLFDPLNIFNPRKKIGADWEYVAKHMKKN